MLKPKWGIGYRMRGMRRIRVGMQGLEWNGNMGNQHGNARNLVGNAKNVGNQAGDAGNENGNLGIAVEMT